MTPGNPLPAHLESLKVPSDLTNSGGRSMNDPVLRDIHGDLVKLDGTANRAPSRLAICILGFNYLPAL